jgi:hypothetical protein
MCASVGTCQGSTNVRRQLEQPRRRNGGKHGDVREVLLALAADGPEVSAQTAAVPHERNGPQERADRGKGNEPGRFGKPSPHQQLLHGPEQQWRREQQRLRSQADDESGGERRPAPLGRQAARRADA